MPQSDDYDTAASLLNRLDDSLLAWKAQQKELVILRAKYIATVGELEEGQDTIEQDQHRIRDINKVNENLVEKNDNQYDIIQNQQTTAELSSESTVVWRKTVADLRAEVETLKNGSRYGHLREQVEKLTDKNERQRYLILDRDAELKRVRGQRNDANSSLGGLKTKIGRLKDEIAVKNTDLEVQQAKIIKLEVVTYSNELGEVGGTDIRVIHQDCSDCQGHIRSNDCRNGKCGHIGEWAERVGSDDDVRTQVRMHDDCPNCGGHDVDDFIGFDWHDCHKGNGKCGHI